MRKDFVSYHIIYLTLTSPLKLECCISKCRVQRRLIFTGKFIV